MILEQEIGQNELTFSSGNMELGETGPGGYFATAVTDGEKTGKLLVYPTAYRLKPRDALERDLWTAPTIGDDWRDWVDTSPEPLPAPNELEPGDAEVELSSWRKRS